MPFHPEIPIAQESCTARSLDDAMGNRNEPSLQPLEANRADFLALNVLERPVAQADQEL